MLILVLYRELMLVVTILWILVRGICAFKNKHIDWKYEFKLLSVYICIAVINRFVYFPMRRVYGQIGALALDTTRVYPFWVNLVPIIPLAEVYDGWIINIIGNIIMFIPVGICWPWCFRKLDTFKKVVIAGIGYTLIIEISQLPFYGRCSDINDILLNAIGVAIGAAIFFGIKRIKNNKTSILK